MAAGCTARSRLMAESSRLKDSAVYCGAPSAAWHPSGNGASTNGSNHGGDPVAPWRADKTPLSKPWRFRNAGVPGG